MATIDFQPAFTNDGTTTLAAFNAPNNQMPHLRRSQ